MVLKATTGPPGTVSGFPKVRFRLRPELATAAGRTSLASFSLACAACPDTTFAAGSGVCTMPPGALVTIPMDAAAGG